MADIKKVEQKGTFVIVSEKKGIRALSGTNDSVEFHNKLFDTDDCVITWMTPEEVMAQKAIDEAKPTPEPKPTLEERVKALEDNVKA